MIVAGLVTVNGEVVTELGTRVLASDDIHVRGVLVDPEPERRYVLLHKPDGTICTLSDPEGRPTVVDLLPADLGRVFPVGRLDYHTEGLLILTNDGDVANALMHPRNAVQRVYRAKVRGLHNPGSRALAALAQPVTLEDGSVVQAKDVYFHSKAEKNTWLEIVVVEGRNREVRQMCENVGLEVVRLKRIAYGPILIEGLGPGQYRLLSPHEVIELKQVCGIET